MRQLFLLVYLCLATVQTNIVQASTLQDPTKPSPNKSMYKLGQDQSTPMALKLSAIINSNQNKQAIINGQSFSEGQHVQGYKVIIISDNHVLLEDSDGQQTLYVNNNNIKKDTNNGF